DMFSFQINSPEQGADRVEHLADAIAVARHSVQNRPQLIDIEWRPAEESQCGTAVRCNGPQRLTHLMRDRSSNDLDVHQLVVTFALKLDNGFSQRQFGPAKVGNVGRDTANPFNRA